MRLVRTSAAVLALAAAVAPPSAAGEFRIRAGPHFRVLCHFDDETVAAAALETVEAIWPAASDVYGLPDGPLDPPLDVHLYRCAADYLAVSREIARGAFDRNLAFSDFATRSSYVAMQPDLTDEALAAIGVTAQTRHVLAHEAAHLLSYRAFPSFRSHPAWVSEGVAIFVEQETLAARGWSAGRNEDPFVATDMVLAQRLLAGGRLPSASQILRDETKDLDLYDRYAVQSLLLRRLVTRNDAPAFRAALAEALRIGEGPDFAKRFLETATRPYAAEGLAGLDLDYEQYVRSQTPAWDEVHRALATAGDAWRHVALAGTNAVAWRTVPVGAGAYEVRGEFEILPGTGKPQQMNVLLAREREEGFVSVAFAARDGVGIWRWHRREDRWEKLAGGPANAVQLWRRVPFRISVAGGRVTVRVDGAEAASADVKDRPMSGAWGLGVQAGGAGVWRGVRVEAAGGLRR